ncbi:alpha/beta fold hydrolase [Bacteroidales bacterium]|nr:alpha/beta fold hydrolase [Bacteroidales bacterium]
MIWIIPVSLLLLLYSILIYYVTEIIVRPSLLDKDNKNLKPDIPETICYEEITYYNRKIKLNAAVALTKHRPVANIIFIHGIRSNKNFYLAHCEPFLRAGFNCIFPDLRAHGKSGGKYTTYGFYEKMDIKLLIDFITKKYNLSAPVVAIGHSMGGAILLQTMEFDHRIKVGIAEAPFSSLYEVTCDYFKRKLKVSNKVLIKFILKNACKKALFNYDRTVPLNSAKNIMAPVMLLHGNNDEKVPLKHSKKIYNHLNAHNRILKIFDNTDHLSIQTNNTDEYYKLVINHLINICEYAVNTK